SSFILRTARPVDAIGVVAMFAGNPGSRRRLDSRDVAVELRSRRRSESSPHSLRGSEKEEIMEESATLPKRSTSRRTFVLGGLAAGGGALSAGRLLANASPARAAGGLTPGDAAILRFFAAAETLETDAWQQYNELGGVQDSEVPGGSGNPPYPAALSLLDSDMPQYIHDNTDDEFTHFTFLNAYLTAHGVQPPNLDQFRTLPSSKASGAQQIGRLTNLMQLSVDTSWWTRYRSDSQNPDFGDTLPQAVPGLLKGEFPVIPR